LFVWGFCFVLYHLWLTVSEVLVCGWLAPLLWACDEAEHQDGEDVVEQSCSSYERGEADTDRKGPRIR
jgi:hypothetical protein